MKHIPEEKDKSPMVIVTPELLLSNFLGGKVRVCCGSDVYEGTPSSMSLIVNDGKDNEVKTLGLLFLTITNGRGIELEDYPMQFDIGGKGAITAGTVSDPLCLKIPTEIRDEFLEWHAPETVLPQNGASNLSPASG